MAILRAGPWGDFGDNHQSQPLPPADGQTYQAYPINVGGGSSFPGSTWQATYETEVMERTCSAPCSIDVSFPYTDDFGATIKTLSVTIVIGNGAGPCSYLYDFPDATYFDPVQMVFRLQHEGVNGRWRLTYGNYYFAYQDETYIYQDESNPITSFTITDSLYYNGYRITIQDSDAP